jgi:hypothetical protein
LQRAVDAMTLFGVVIAPAGSPCRQPAELMADIR